MILYHGTILTYAQNILMHGVDVSYGESQRRTDFGAGFYTTTNRDFAKRCARTKSLFHCDDTNLNSTPVVVLLKYDVSRERSFKKLNFQKPDMLWRKFVCYHRFEDVSKKNDLYFDKFDVVSGPVLDGQFYEFVGMVKKNNYVLSDYLLEQMVPFQMNSTYAVQKSFHNPELASCLQVIGYDII